MRVFLFFIALLIVSCGPQTVEEEAVIYQNDTMRLKSSLKPFTGNIISKFEDGKISSQVSYHNGQKRGNWFDKGYYGEIIHEGEHIDCDAGLVDLIKRKTGNDFCGCSLDLWTEGDVSFVTLRIKSAVNLDDATNSLIYNQYLKKYQKKFTEIEILDGDSVLAAKSYPY